MNRKSVITAMVLAASLAVVACQAEETEEPPVDVGPQTLLEDIEERGTIRISTDPNYAPQSFLEPDGSFVGFDVDVANEIGSRLGVDVEFVTPDWDLITAGNWADQWDISVGSMMVTTAREKVLHFASPAYYYTPAQFAAANGSGINTLEDLDGQAVCMGTATTYETWLLGDLEGLGLPAASLYAEAPDVEIVTMSTDSECIQAIQAGREEFSAVLTSSTVVEAAMAEGVGIHKVDTPVFSENLAVSVDRNHSLDPRSLVTEIGDIVAAMHADGTLRALSMEWFGEDITFDPTTVEAPLIEIGSEASPIKVLFVPSVDAAEIITGGELLSQVLTDATGLAFEVTVPTSYAATIEEMCASPDNTMGFIPGLGYVLANQLCGVDVSAKAERFGYDWYAAMFVVQRDSPFQSIEDLEGATWATPTLTSTSGYLYPTYLFQQAGITPGETVETGGHTGAMRAVYNGEVDFATGFYSPYRVDGTSIVWLPGDDPSIPEDLVASCANTEDDRTIMCGNAEPRDARRNIRSEVPDAIQKLRIIGTTSQITNDTVSFGPDFPPELRDAIMTALFAFSEGDPDGFAEAMDHYSWTAVLPTTDAEYDDIRVSVEAAGFSLEDLGG